VLVRIPADDYTSGARPGQPAPTPEDFLGLLARAVQQFQTYPSTSPLCLAAIEASHRALAALDGGDQLSFRVTPSELLVDERPTGRGAVVGRELAVRLHRAAVMTVTLDRGASLREIGRFCEGLVRCGARGAGPDTLHDWLTEHGIEHVTVEMASRPEVLEVGATSPDAAPRIARERARFEAQIARGGAVHHLYPPRKGWVRLDPAAAPPSVSLLDLAILVDDPAALAAMLLRLTDDAGDVSAGEALQQKYSDVAMLIAALDPPVARRLFGKLARAVLDLDPAGRQALLRRTVLPGLLDGRIDGAILRDFPDVELAESLCLLLDLETAAPELLATALSRLDLSTERQASVTPLLDAKLREREATAAEGGRMTTLARRARELVRVDAAADLDFAEFSAFDLSMDEAAITALAEIRAALPAADALVDQLTCLWHLVWLEPNPECVSRYLDRSFALLEELEHASRGGELPAWLAAYRSLSDRLGEPRPDVAETITRRLGDFCTPARVAWLVELSRRDTDGRTVAHGIIQALGPGVAAPLTALLEAAAAGGSARDRAESAKAAAQLLVEHAATLAPRLPPLLPTCTPAVRRTLLRVLGAAGPGYEECIASHVSALDEPTAREALRALARLGTARAAALVVAHVVRQDGPLSVAAEETLWHFPPAEAERRTRELLARREFTMRHPDAAERLLDRAARAGSAGLEPVLQAIAPLRFRIWNPALVRVARKAHRMLQPSV
jgi:hypothetical protein